MKKLLFGTMLLALVIIVPIPTMAGVDIHVSIPLPPPIVFAAPPEVIVLPETEVYVVPDVQEDIFFYNGWWWRPWGGRWYRSRSYSEGWVYYQSVPSFYVGIPSGWRNDYRDHRWGGGVWNHQRIHYGDLHRNWRGWHNTRHWEQPQYRQHTLHRDGKPYGAHGTQRGNLNRGKRENTPAQINKSREQEHTRGEAEKHKR